MANNRRFTDGFEEMVEGMESRLQQGSDRRIAEAKIYLDHVREARVQISEGRASGDVIQRQDGERNLHNAEVVKKYIAETGAAEPEEVYHSVKQCGWRARNERDIALALHEFPHSNGRK